MFRLQQKKKEAEDAKKQAEASPMPSLAKQMSVRSRFLTKEVSELQSLLPKTCQLEFEDVDDLRGFKLTIRPEEGYWKGGVFKFEVSVPPEYNLKPPQVECKTKIWHPNITEEGKVCLSILREHSMDGTGWLPTRTLKEVVWGLNSLFTDLLNFDDPLNVDAAQQFTKDKAGFEWKVTDYIRKYAHN